MIQRARWSSHFFLLLLAKPRDGMCGTVWPGSGWQGGFSWSLSLPVRDGFEWPSHWTANDDGFWGFFFRMIEGGKRRRSQKKVCGILFLSNVAEISTVMENKLHPTQNVDELADVSTRESIIFRPAPPPSPRRWHWPVHGDVPTSCPHNRSKCR